MKRVIAGFIGGFFLTAGLVAAETKGHWGYAGHEGPEHWGELSPEYALCGSGKNQSPVNLTGMIEAELEPISFAYQGTPLEVENNGHSIKAGYAGESTMEIDGTSFKLLQFHFHTPSENHIEGKSYPMEAHLVHADKDGNLAVVAVMFAEGKGNSLISSVVDHMPEEVGKTNRSEQSINVMDMLPENKDYYRFNGSLTTPPCTEGVRWLVMKDTVEVTKEQVAAFKSVMHENNRPVQPCYARPVLK